MNFLLCKNAEFFHKIKQNRPFINSLFSSKVFKFSLKKKKIKFITTKKKEGKTSFQGESNSEEDSQKKNLKNKKI